MQSSELPRTVSRCKKKLDIGEGLKKSREYSLTGGRGVHGFGGHPHSQPILFTVNYVSAANFYDLAANFYDLAANF